DLRANSPKSICGSLVVQVRDYLSQTISCDGQSKPTGLPKSDVLQFVTSDSTIVSVRPSGTEPKIKFYFGVCEPLCCASKYAEVAAKLDAKMESIAKELGIK
ncbi:MAG: phospho-sugar mutase, partial [Mucinivorans sp.]